jgi:hypothetical protein
MIPGTWSINNITNLSSIDMDYDLLTPDKGAIQLQCNDFTGE